MKTRTIIILTIALFNISNVWAQTNDTKDYLWSYESKKGIKEIGLYGELSMSYSEILARPAGYLGAKIGVVFNHRWAFGWGGSGLWYDYRLDELVNDGTYHMEGGYQGLFAQYMLPVGERVKVNFSVLSGTGIAMYKYDKDYQESREWYEESIDLETFAVFEPAAEAMVKVGNRTWVGVNGSFRNTSPIKLKGTDEGFLNNFNAGISVKYGIF